MSTRGAIVRQTEGGFEGRYHHWDSYPSGLGKALWDAYHGPFQSDLPRLAKTLIDDHPAGWSSIVGVDWSREPGYIEYPNREAEGVCRPKCYCHGDRSEEENRITQNNAADCGCEFVYVLSTIGPPTLTILSSFRTDGTKMVGFFGYGDPDAVWRPKAIIELNGPEPDWDHLDEQAVLSVRNRENHQGGRDGGDYGP